MKITDELFIAADAERVWDLTVDVERWPALTPTITSVERLEQGPLGPGSTARIVQPAQRPATWTVTQLEPQRVFAWHTKVATITMTGTHVLEPVDGGCLNTLTVELAGFGSGLLSRLTGGRIRQAIRTENEGFKSAAESAADRSAP